MRKEVIWIIFGALVLVGLAIAGSFLYFYTGSCDNKDCFYQSIADCRRVSFINDNGEITMEYKIKGASGKTCVVDVSLLQIKEGSSELEPLEGKSMECFVALGTAADPEKNLQNCHGDLKEGIQDIIINRLHTQIVQNLGKINNETKTLF